MGEPVFRSKSEGRVLIEADATWWRDTLTAAANYSNGVEQDSRLPVEMRVKGRNHSEQCKRLLSDIS